MPKQPSNYAPNPIGIYLFNAINGNTRTMCTGLLVHKFYKNF